MTAFALAWQTVRRYRARTILATIGVAVIGALLFDMLLLSRGLLLSFADLLNSAGYDIRVVAGEGVSAARGPIGESARLARDIAALPAVDRVALIRIEPAVLRTDNGSRSLTLIGTTDTGGAAWSIVEGRNLRGEASAAGSCELVIARPLGDALAIRAGSPATISARPSGASSALPPTTCVVVGIARFAFAASDEFTAAAKMDAFSDIAGTGGAVDADLVLVASKSEADSHVAARAISKLRPDLRVLSNEQVVAQFNRNGFAYFRQISVVLASLTMVFAFLLVATLLTVSINQRLGEVAAMRALGIGRRKIASMLLWESGLLVGAGGALALPLGGALAMALDRILRQMPGLPERLHFFVFEGRALAVHVALLMITALAAAAYPMWLTARLPIAATLRREVVD